MVIVSSHITVVIARELYNTFMSRERVQCSTPVSVTMGIPAAVEDAILQLSGVISFDQLEEAVRDALELALPNVTDAVVYVENPETQELVSSHGLVHTLPKEGLPLNAIQRRERIVVSDLDPADPISGLITFSRNGGSAGSRKVLCSPVVDVESDKVVAVFVVVCNNLSKEDHQHLNFLEKQFVVCHRRLKLTGCPSSRISSNTSVTQPIQPNKERRNSASPILKLCADLYDQDAASLQIKVLQYLLHHTESESGFILLVDLEHRELFCQVIGQTILKDELRFPIEQTNFTSVLRTKRPLTLPDLSPSHKQDLEKELGLTMDTMLGVPVINKASGEVMAVAFLLNKKQGASYTDADIEMVQHCFKYTATVLHSTLAVQSERTLKNQTQALLQVARNLFTHLDDLTRLLREIMQEARTLTKAERCSVFLLEKENNELVAKVFDGDVQEGKEQMIQLLESEVRIPADQGIAGHVATTGNLLNIDDAYSHPLFYRGVDETTGFRTRNILCFPIKDENDEVIGVAQLCNKIHGAGFSIFDEDIAQAFSVFCCMSIVHSLMYKSVRDSQHRSRLSNELMTYHMQVASEDVFRLSFANIPPPKEFNSCFDQFSYIPRNLQYDKTPLAVLSMFDDMGFISKYRISRETLAKFVLMVRKGYRDPPYHNWAHALAVAHFCYLIHKNLGLHGYLDDIDIFALFVACLCHDIDHRGTTNSYQVASDSVLAALYSSEGSVMERHHFAQTMCIINLEGCNIFDNLSKSEYEKVLDLMRDIILATDLAHHLRITKDLEKMADDGFSKENTSHRMLLLCLLMTSCDLSDQTKTWGNSKQIAELIYQEFFSQGDLEKTLGRNPSEMMDRDKACIPELQIGFLDGIALPVFRMLTKVFPDSGVVLSAVQNNRHMWTKVSKKLKEMNLPSNMDVFKLELTEESLVDA